MTSTISTFYISGMTCEACEKLLQKRLGKIPEVTEVVAQKDSGKATVIADRPITQKEVQIALEGTQYSIEE